jgi:multiple sugar transport system permease protein
VATIQAPPSTLLGPARPVTPARRRGSRSGPRARGGGSRSARRREAGAGYVFLSPWLLGFMAITAVPMFYSLYLSFTNWDLISNSGQYVGLRNYRRMFTVDPAFWHSVKVTATYALTATPLKLAVALGVAMLLMRNRRGTGTARAMFYLPSLLGGSVALALVWQSLFSRDGAFNRLLDTVGLTGPAWVNDPRYVMWTIVLLGVWQFGAPMVIFLAGLKQIPPELYEAAAVDGAGRWRQFFHITLPSLSPVIFFNLVLETIHSFQIFTSAYVIGGGQGGPVDATKVYTLLLYLEGFVESHIGYASALAWVFLVAIGLLTVVFFSTGRFWVHYADSDS